MPRGRRAADETNGTQAPPSQMSLNLDKETAEDILLQINAKESIMNEARTDLANLYQRFEAAGGDRKMLKVTKRFLKQDISKTISEKRALDQYYSWFVQPKVDEATGDEH